MFTLAEEPRWTPSSDPEPEGAQPDDNNTQHLSDSDFEFVSVCVCSCTFNGVGVC